ncbi:MAG TPA: 50S ribosomal protein L24 [Candidatus Obscuribacterales bacterium]
MAGQSRKPTRYSKSPIAKKVKMGGTVVLSEALVNKKASNTVPKIHVKRGDMVMLISGPKKNDPKRSPQLKKRLDAKNAYKGTTGKVIAVFPKEGKVIVEGVNLITRASKPRMGMGKTGLIKKEGPIYASKVMLYSTTSKKPVRAEFRKKEGLE